MASIGNITFACEDPDRLADFWIAALGYVKQDAPPDLIEAIEAQGGDLNMAAAAVDPQGKGPRLYFEKKAKPPVSTMPIHLDLNAEDPDAEVLRLSDLGATVIARRTETIGPYTSTWTVMADPEGNVFCVQ